MIGILAGMGPKSTAPFVDRVVTECQQAFGAKYDSDYPPMMIYACPTPFYIDRPLDHAAMEAAIVAGARRLEATGVDFIAMPCMSAHVYFENIRTALAVPLINMVEETVADLPQGGEKVAVLATPSVIEAQLFQPALAARGLRFADPSGWQSQVNAVIAAVKAGGLETALPLWRVLLERVRAEADALVVACTDLSPLMGQETGNIPAADCAASLARATARRYYEDSRKRPEQPAGRKG